MRYELKYNPLNLNYANCVSVIRQHPASFYQEYPDRQVNNIYLDVSDFNFLRENTAGVSERKKYRIRWYGPEFEKIINPVLEVKIKENMLGTKVARGMESFDLATVNETIRCLGRKGLVPGQLQPVSTNSYLRSYFISMDSLFRITIDREMKFGNFLRDPGIPDRACDEIIVELKYNQENDDEAERIRQYLPFQRTRFSKYVFGVLRYIQ